MDDGPPRNVTRARRGRAWHESRAGRVTFLAGGSSKEARDLGRKRGARMSEPGRLADQFEHWRPHLASVAYGMLGSVSEAEDAVQQAWLRLRRSDAGTIIDLRAWLTTVVGRICLDTLRARQNHRVEHLGAW